jgi:hypothetical protein
MAGSAPEGTQFDARQYDAKMDSMYVQLFLAVPHVFSLSVPHLESLTYLSQEARLIVVYKSRGIKVLQRWWSAEFCVLYVLTFILHGGFPTLAFEMRHLHSHLLCCQTGT